MTPKNNIVGKQIQELPLIVKNDIVQSPDTIYPKHNVMTEAKKYKGTIRDRNKGDGN